MQLGQYFFPLKCCIGPLRKICGCFVTKEAASKLKNSYLYIHIYNNAYYLMFGALIALQYRLDSPFYSRFIFGIVAVFKFKIYKGIFTHIPTFFWSNCVSSMMLFWPIYKALDIKKKRKGKQKAIAHRITNSQHISYADKSAIY